MPRAEIGHVDCARLDMQTSTTGGRALTDASAERSQARGGNWRGRVMRLLFLALALTVIGMIISRATAVEWSEVGSALRDYSPLVLLSAMGLALLGHAAAGSFDLIGRHYVGHRLPAHRVVTINLVAYAFSINLGALVGGWAFRARLYSRFALRAGDIAQVIALAVITNWSGFVLILALTLLAQPPQLPSPWTLDPWLLRAIGGVLLLVVISYLGLCGVGRERGWCLRVRGIRLRVPSLRMALVQLAVSSASWILMAAALARLLPPELPFLQVLAVLFVTSVAGAMLHVPGNLGVMEGSLAKLLSADVPVTQVLAAALAFRAVYFFIPFLLAALAYGFLELMAGRRAGNDSADRSAS